jgi:Reverse transcriptase (RNA-dependent DNA polymerase)
VVHKKLIAKLTCYGVNAILVKWIESYIAGRFQYVRIGSSKSKCCPVLSGMPQGSIIGPVSFIIFVNDISQSWSSTGVRIKFLLMTLNYILCCKMILFLPLSCSLAWMLFLNGLQSGS